MTRRSTLHRLKLARLALAATVLAPSAASAAVTYDFAGSFEADTDGDEVNELYAWTFSFTAPDFINSLTEITPLSCTVTGSFYGCAATQTIDPNGETFPSAAGIPYLGFNVSNLDGSGGGTSFYFFSANAFSQLGAHVAQNPPDGSGLGNAGPATLLLSGQVGAVPEPATWAMLILGFGLIGAAARSRRAPALTWA